MDCSEVDISSKIRLTDRLTRTRSIDLCSLTKKGGDYLSKAVRHGMAAVSPLPPPSPIARRLVQQMITDLRAEMNTVPSVVVSEPYQLLECPSCEGFMNKPICLPCGHSLCKSCLERPSDKYKNTIICSCCKNTFNKIPVGFQKCRSSTVLLQKVSVKWYPILLECCNLREKGNSTAHGRNLSDAILQYTRALETGEMLL